MTARQDDVLVSVDISMMPNRAIGRVFSLRRQVERRMHEKGMSPFGRDLVVNSGPALFGQLPETDPLQLLADRVGVQVMVSPYRKVAPYVNVPVGEDGHIISPRPTKARVKRGREEWYETLVDAPTLDDALVTGNPLGKDITTTPVGYWWEVMRGAEHRASNALRRMGRTYPAQPQYRIMWVQFVPDFLEIMGSAVEEYIDARNQYVRLYRLLIREAQKHLGRRFHPEKFPDPQSLMDTPGITYRIMPVPGEHTPMPIAN